MDQLHKELSTEAMRKSPGDSGSTRLGRISGLGVQWIGSDSMDSVRGSALSRNRSDIESGNRPSGREGTVATTTRR